MKKEESIETLYPFVGGTPPSRKWNLKDPRNIDAALHQPLVIGSVCEHPQRQREYYRDKCYKCWECLKIAVE